MAEQQSNVHSRPVSTITEKWRGEEAEGDKKEGRRGRVCASEVGARGPRRLIAAFRKSACRASPPVLSRRRSSTGGRHHRQDR